ncbi:MAG TPA: hypothetical protein VJT70_02305 [Sphingomicrobium sp.]|nr:hypothetical protein [Sphingomicrobium sp.]
MRASRFVLIGTILALAGCGRQVDLKPAPGHPMPVKPLMARTTPTVAELLTPPTYARPDRVDELVKKSQPRQSDPFDLPPPSGGNAPTLPAGTDPSPVTNDTGPATPK